MKTITDVVDEKAPVLAAIKANSGCDASYMTMNALASVIACYGLFENSPAVIIGAMIIAMLLGPISGLALGLINDDNRLVYQAFITLTCGVVLVYGIGIVLGVVHADLPLTAEIYARTAPNVMDLAIALAGGFAGAFALTSSRLNAALVGVAISTALVPPLVSSAVCLARGEYQLSAGAFLLAFTNMVAIQVASSTVFWLRGYRGLTDNIRARRALQRNALSAALLIALVATLTVNLRQLVRKEIYEVSLRTVLRRESASHQGAYLADLRLDRGRDRLLVTAVFRAPAAFTPEQVRQIELALPRPTSGPGELELRIRTIPVTVASRDGYLYATEHFTDADR